MRNSFAASHRIRSWLFMAGTASLALVTASQQLQLIYGITFVFTNLFIMLLYRLFGLRTALPVAAAAYGAAVLAFHIPLFVLIFLMEVCWVTLLHKKTKRSPLKLNVWFWAACGLPLILLACLLSGPFDATEFVLLFFLSAVNGLFNVLLSEIIYYFVPIKRLLKRESSMRAPIPFRMALLNASIAIVAVPFLLIMMISGWKAYDASLHMAGQIAGSTTSILSEELSHWSEEELLGIRLRNRIQLAHLHDLLDRHADYRRYHLTLANEDRIPLASTMALEEFKAWKPKRFAMESIEDHGFRIEMPRQSAVQLLPTERWRDANYVYKAKLDSLPLTLSVIFPVSSYKDHIFQEYIYYLTSLLVSAAIAAGLALGMNRWLSQGLMQLAGSTTNLPDKLKQRVAMEWPVSGILEVNSVVHNVKEMSNNLQLMFQESEHMNEQLRMSEEKLHHLAFYDSLTGMPNRHHFRQSLEALFAEVDGSDERIAVMFVDLNRFKQINDSLGHAAGDVLLQHVAGRFTWLADGSSQVFRLGGDEFVFVQRFRSEEAPGRLAEQICGCFNEPFELMGASFYTAASVGISLYPEHGQTIDDIVKKADIAMYVAKENGPSGYHLFDKELEDTLSEKMELENGLRNALKNQELFLEYQPKVHPNTGTPLGFEALIRWRHPVKGLISPVKFIPLAEASGIITDIDLWVFREACEQTKEWQAQGLPALPISVNLSAKHFGQPMLVERIRAILNETGVDGKSISIEITESVFIRQVEEVIDVLGRIRAMGIDISIDDFGTGYSSLSQLQRLPISVVKLDRTFISGADKDALKSSIVKAVIELAHSMGLKVVAEGIETEEERSFFEELNCDELQGYYFSKPLPRERLELYIKTHFNAD
ncbi:putative bifunctional diguanylate cyclase/phosphodiesterase [Paenibacillus soyae]|uniref:EAL domain-containing protein n=1 Tax=Paenibacillus soyae TaxID=2969249 RepID=A0A9X2SBF6_9BACL|nr:EAL domain-containing protein [Paenibacillus soyae]MCR2807020.1 EAL domain-containing protein [Paenibacillus soyae]